MTRVLAGVDAQRGARRRDVGIAGAAARADGDPHRRGRPARRRLLRHRGEPRRAGLGGRARRPDRGLARDRGARPRPSRRPRPRRPRGAPPARPRPPGAHLPGGRSGPRRRLPAAALARRVPEQPAAAAHVVRGPRRRDRARSRRRWTRCGSSRSSASGVSARPASRRRSRPRCCRGSPTARGCASSRPRATRTRWSQVVAATLGVQPHPKMTLEGSIVDYLRAKRLLVVLDNCEHLLEAAGDLAEGDPPGVSRRAPARHEPRRPRRAR